MSPFHGGYIRGAAVGYVLPPLAAKLRCARTAGTFFIMACHRGGSVYGAAAPSPPSEGFGFRAPPVADAARRQAAAVREREIAKPKRERRAAREQSWILLPLCGNKRLRERYTKAARKQYVQACTKVIGTARLPCTMRGAHSLPLGEGGTVRRSPHRDG